MAKRTISDKGTDDSLDTTFEKCVICGCSTNVKISDPIDIRKHYVSGCGQLCEYCYLQINSYF